jgi:putative peptidoglycan lipid II flippase
MRLRALLSGSGRSVAANATIVAAAFAASRALGMVREMVIAARFGTGETYDAYVAAFRVPDLLFALVMSGAFGAAFIPVFGGYLAQGDGERAWRLANTLLTWTTVVFLAIAQLIFLFAEPLIGEIVAPELPPDGQRLAVDLTRVLLLSPLLLGFGAAGKGMLEAQDAFTLPAVAPILYTLGSIAGAVFLAPLFGIYGLVWGVILGAAAYMVVQFAWLLRNGLQIRPSLSLRSDGVGQVARLMGPRVLGQSASQVNLIVMTNFASRLGDGSISAVNYAQQLVMLPLGILAMSLSTVIFPRMSRQFATGRIGGLRRTLVAGLGPLIFLTIPATIVLIVFRTSIVHVLFQYGSFSSESTELVAEAVGLFALSLLARSLIEPITRAFYAMHDTRTPVVIAVMMVLVNIALTWVLVEWLGFAGVPLSLSITYTARLVALGGILSRRTGGAARQLLATTGRMVPPALAMTAVSLALMDPMARVTDPTLGRSVGDYVIFAVALAGVSGVYGATAYLLRVPESRDLVQVATRRIGQV